MAITGYVIRTLLCIRQCYAESCERAVAVAKLQGVEGGLEFRVWDIPSGHFPSQTSNSVYEYLNGKNLTNSNSNLNPILMS